MTQPNLDLYIFYHDRAKLDDVMRDVDESLVHVVNLNELPVPPELRIDSLTEDENRAALSEYLGHLAIKPKRNLVGLFTYSIPKKFSHEWARTTGAFETFLPAVDFNTLLDLRYREGKLYGLEFTDVNAMLAAEAHRRSLASKLSIPHFPKGRLAPLKGAVVVERRIFEEYQAWILGAAKFLIRNYNWQDNTAATPFSGSEFGGKSEKELHVGRFRAGLGAEIERATAYFFSKRFDDGDKIRIGDLVRQSNVNRPLAAVAEKAKRETGTLIITFASSVYLEALNNWSHAMRRLRIANWAVMALDDKIYELMKERGVSVYRVRCKPDFSDIWLQRIEVIEGLLKAGINVIHSDLDAIWLKDPRALLQESSYDIISSQGTYWPRPVHAKWGFVLCCGFIYYRSSNRMIDLASRIKEAVIRAPRSDDQAELNTFLAEDGIEWTISQPTYVKSHNDVAFTCSRRWIIGKGKLYKVALLPHHEFQRVVMREDFSKAYVVHPVSAKTGEAVMDVLRNNGLIMQPPRLAWTAARR